MEILYHGKTCFTIKSKTATIVMDPYKGAKGLKADMVTTSTESPDHGSADAVSGKPYVIDWPGEYDKNEIVVEGIELKQDNEDKLTAFTLLIEGINVTHLSAISQEPSPDVLEQLQTTDVLLIPTGEGSLDAAKARALAEKIEARITIPMLAEDTAPFMKEMGVAPECVPSLKVTKKDLPVDDSKTICLEPKN